MDTRETHLGGTMDFPIHSGHEYRGCTAQPVDLSVAENRTHTGACRYKIISSPPLGSDGRIDAPFGPLKLLELSGDIPQLFIDHSFLGSTAETSNSSVGQGDRKHNRKAQQPMPINAMNIERCFAVNNDPVLSRTTTVDSHADVSIAWATIRTPLPLFQLEDEVGSARRNGRIIMTIGNNVLNGKCVVLESGDHILVMKKVETHCSCSCVANDDMERKCEETHGAYFEICAVTKAKIIFNERPSIMQHLHDVDSDIPWFLCQSQNMELINPNWLLLRVSLDIVDDFMNDKAYFKIVRDNSGKDETKLILSVNDETYYLERIELGGKVVLVNPTQIETRNGLTYNLLSILGCCKFLHNLVNVTPNFAPLHLKEDTALQNILDALPIADAQIKSFLMNSYEEWPCECIFLKGGHFTHIDALILAEFTVTLLRLLDIYFNQQERRGKSIQDLTAQDVWSLVHKFQGEFGFLPERMQTPAVTFQLLRFVSDVQVPFNELEDYMYKLENGELFDAPVRLNLFKMHKLIVWAICVANEDRKVTYAELVKKVDSLLFTKMLPSYIFEEMIRYLTRNEVSTNEDVGDYVKCLKFYYEKSSFSEVADDMSRRFKRQSRSTAEEPERFSTGKKLFLVGEVDKDLADERGAECYNYDIFKLNTKGLTRLRFKYAMNTLLAMCRCPMSLHVAMIADRIVTTEEGDTCLLQVYPREKVDSLRDVLSSLFRLNKRWHLDDIEKKLVRFLGNRQPLDSITGAPNFHTRLWITNETNTLNCCIAKRETSKGEATGMLVADDIHSALKPINEESYIIINSNVPL
ncbi:uncharacterized protein BXIN_1812 [Babesia sp. Xinjiang]|uniref:uncharacterized protein n=1 Tax=Babesia sp. Xinjiang TaxID=462227 RepID=UPI000A23C142|nr:uncharacterized protein BXIN_1812 [Babesia sp. Xinjiang]ORM42232.1 hypothetical protein BXIN_1812 [Babesia sp. Xinjiang]